MSDNEQYDFEEIKKALAKDNNEAEDRYKKFKSADPFPDIAPALLNSADFIDYVIATGMIYPFYPEKAKLKPASYAVSLLGKCVYSINKSDWITKDLKKGDTFRLEKNSIAFVELEPQFRIPDYIALRFNLKITHVYRGLLLGTGPLVDPGFKGKLYIPLHNLTTNDYQFEGCEDLIYFEFTKISPIEKWKRHFEIDYIDRKGLYVSFPKRKVTKRNELIHYLTLADRHRTIRSSIPEMLSKTEKELKIVRSERLIGYTMILISFFAVLFTIWQLFFQVKPLVIDTTNYIKKVNDQNISFQNEINNEIAVLKGEIDLLRSNIADSTKTK